VETRRSSSGLVKAMAYENFAVERAGAIATVYFNRPEKLNPISGKLLSEMIAVAHEFQEDEESRVVILTGKGRSFCAGADLADSLRMPVRKRSAARRMRHGCARRVSAGA